MGKKLAGTGAGWLATVRKVFTPTAASNKDPRHAKKQRGRAVESSAAAGGGGEAAAEVVSVEHFPPAAETSSPEVTNDEGVGAAVVWLEREVAAACSRRDHHRRRGVAAAEVASSRVARMAVVRGRTGACREERAAVRIQAFYRGYLARRALRALRGLVRLQAVVRGRLVRRQVHRTMRCMQALVRAQDRVRAGRRLPSPYAAGRRACRPGPGVIVQRHPGLLVPRQQQQHQQRGEGGRRSFGHDAGDHETPEQQQQDPPRRSNVSPPPNFLQETWGAVRADGMLLRHDTAAATRPEIDLTTYAYELQRRRRQTDESNAGWRHWMESCTHAGGVHHPPQNPDLQHHGAVETSYVTTEGTTDAVSDNTVELEAAEESPARDLYPDLRPPMIPRYMTATQSARAKARVAPPLAAPSRATHARTRSGSAAPSGGSASTSSMGSWGVSRHNGGARALQQRAAHSPESSCSGDRLIPTQLGGWSRLAFASASSQQHI